LTPLYLRIDVCTYQGLREGVPALLAILRRQRARATFFIPFGPDASGLALLKLLNPAFAWKMIRTRAGSTYGWSTAFYGTLLPSPMIGLGLPDLVRRVRDEGHEVGAHGWDHRRWQDRLPRYKPEKLRDEFRRMVDASASVLGARPAGFAAPAWRATPDLLDLEAETGFRYAADVRGTAPFLPVLEDRPFPVPQLPVTLPTLDECLGRATPEAFAQEILRRAAGQPAYCCFAAHAESEGRAHGGTFESILANAGRPIVPLEEAPRTELPRATIRRGRVEGRPYDVCLQE
jgi:undecaprenyl phosphate-alpha-L-ara4FN deformylase